MANLLDLLMGTNGGWNPDVQQTGVRPGYGLGTATGVERPVRSEFQRTLDPGETRTPSQLQEMLAEVILAAGSGAVPAAGPRGQARQVPGARLAKGIKGQGGSEIVGYEWRSKLGETYSQREGGLVSRRVSDWDRKGTSTGTGRDIVHVFDVKHPDGTVTKEGINSASKILGLSAQRLKSIAAVEAGKQAYEARQNAELVRDFESNRSAASPGEAEALFRKRNPPSPLRPNDPPAVGTLMRKGDLWTKAHVGHAGVLERAGWERIE